MKTVIFYTLAFFKLILLLPVLFLAGFNILYTGFMEVIENKYEWPVRNFFDWAETKLGIE